jgi:CheY-like chemotaxis protein
MARVLIVEDESVLRTSLVRGISKMDDVVVDAAANVNQALVLIDAEAPDIIISDIDMPERTGIELLGELGARGLDVPIVFVSAYLKAYGAQIPRHANIEVLEKPVGLHDLRQLIVERVAPNSEPPSGPFTVPDFLQLASLGRRSVAIEASWEDGTAGRIVVCRGEVWHAECADLEGAQAFAAVAWRGDARVRCLTVNGDLGPRTLEGTAEALLMDTARLLDEDEHDGEESFVERARQHSVAPPDDDVLRSWHPEDSEPPHPEPTAERAHDSEPVGPEPSESDPIEEAFQRQLERGVSALLERSYNEAFAAFSTAEAIRPGHTTVLANIGRLREMGYGDASSEDEA